jgi:hypothetical protein
VANAKHFGHIMIVLVRDDGSETETSAESSIMREDTEATAFAMVGGNGDEFRDGPEYRAARSLRDASKFPTSPPSPA